MGAVLVQTEEEAELLLEEAVAVGEEGPLTEYEFFYNFSCLAQNKRFGANRYWGHHFVMHATSGSLIIRNAPKKHHK